MAAGAVNCTPAVGNSQWEGQKRSLGAGKTRRLSWSLAVLMVFCSVFFCFFLYVLLTKQGAFLGLPGELSILKGVDRRVPFGALEPYIAK